jgi:hypothetical protein
MESLKATAYKFISNHGFAERRRKISNNQNSLFALRSFAPGEVIADFSASTISAEPTYLTVQISVRKHITLQPEFLQYINHSCSPNVFFDTTTMQVEALRPIQKGEELTFFYPCTEWKMVQPFPCYCSSPNCIGNIRGAAYIPEDVLKQYRLTDFIQQQLVKRAAKKVA